MSDMGILEMRKAECRCCGPWIVESGDLHSEFSDKDDARDFYMAERVRRLARIFGITDQRRIDTGIRNLTKATK